MAKRRIAQKTGSLADTVENPGAGQEMSRTFPDLRSIFGTSNKTSPFHCLDQWRSFARKFARKLQSERTSLSFCFAVAVVVCLSFFSLTKTPESRFHAAKNLFTFIGRISFAFQAIFMLITEISGLKIFW